MAELSSTLLEETVLLHLHVVVIEWAPVYSRKTFPAELPYFYILFFNIP